MVSLVFFLSEWWVIFECGRLFVFVYQATNQIGKFIVYNDSGIVYAFPNLKTNNKYVLRNHHTKALDNFFAFFYIFFFRVVSRYKSCDKNMFVFRCLGRVRSRTPACFCGDSIIISTHLPTRAHTHAHAHLTEQEDSRPITSDSCVVWAGTQSPSYDTIGVSQSRYGFFMESIRW